MCVPVGICGWRPCVYLFGCVIFRLCVYAFVCVYFCMHACGLGCERDFVFKRLLVYMCMLVREFVRVFM